MSTPFNYIRKNTHSFILLLLIIIYDIYFTAASFLRYENFYTGRFDLGHMTQTVWNTSNGRFFQFSDTSGSEIISRLSAHADFLLILLAPFYFIWSDPRMLLLILTIVLSVGAFFVYLIAKDVLKNKTLALVLSAAYLLSPAVGYNNLYDFHAVSLATTFFLGAFYFLLRKKIILTLVFLVLASLTKEQVWITTGIFGIYMFLISKERFRKILSIALCLFSFFISYFLISYAIPQNRGESHFALAYFSDYGDNPTEIVKNVILSPQKTIETVFQKNQINYLKQMFGPLGFLSLLSPLYLVFALPDLAINLLSNNPQLHQIYYQYTSTITPFVFIAAIFGIKNLMKIFPKIPPSLFFLYLIFTMLMSFHLWSPLPGSKHPNTNMFTKPQKNKEIINEYLSKMPQKASVSSTNNLGSHLSHRKKIFNVPAGIGSSDYVLFLINDSFGKRLESENEEILVSLRKNKNYLLAFEKDNFIVFKKKIYNN